MFTFKQFTIDDSACAMKVGTDGVLLGAWAEVDNAATRRVLDIGTGSGLIALMLAQRLPESRIVGIDIVPEAVEAARRNAAASPFAGRIAMLGAAPQVAVCDTLPLMPADGSNARSEAYAALTKDFYL